MERRFHDLVEMFEASSKQFADRPLLGTRSERAGWTYATYAELSNLVDRFRGGLAKLGVGPGDRVAIISANRLEWAVGAYATYGLEAAFVPMYEAQRVDEWKFILADSGAKVVICSTDDIARSVGSMRDELPALKEIIVLTDGAPDGASPTLRFHQMLDVGRRNPTPSRQPGGDALAGFVYTSGTTGRPKGVLLTHDNIVSNVEAATSIFPVTAEDRTLSFLPWAHVYGQVIELHILVSVGASTALNADLTHLLDDLIDVKPTMLVAVPRIFNRLFTRVRRQLASQPRFLRALVDRAIRTANKRRRNEPIGTIDSVGLRLADALVFSKVRAKLGGRLRYAISASAALSLEVAELIDAMGIEVYEGYGLTETSPIVSANRPGSRKMGSAGRPIPGVAITIEPIANEQVGHGEIVVHGPNVMRGYHARPDEDAKTLRPDGGLSTGDIGYLDDDGFLWITGRVKEQYKLENGKYVMPSPLEEVLKLSPYILNSLLYGANQPFNVAVIVLDPQAVREWAKANAIKLDSDICADASVRRLISDEIARVCHDVRRYEQPKDFILTLDDFTVASGLLTPTLKLKRREVTELYRERLEGLYARAGEEEGDVGKSLASTR